MPLDPGAHKKCLLFLYEVSKRYDDFDEELVPLMVNFFQVLENMMSVESFFEVAVVNVIFSTESVRNLYLKCGKDCPQFLDSIDAHRISRHLMDPVVFTVEPPEEFVGMFLSSFHPKDSGIKKNTHFSHSLLYFSFESHSKQIQSHVS
jgi:hypothetical protein